MITQGHAAAFVAGFLIVCAITIIPAKLGYGIIGEYQHGIEECQKDLPRNEKCKMVFVKEVK